MSSVTSTKSLSTSQAGILKSIYYQSKHAASLLDIAPGETLTQLQQETIADYWCSMERTNSRLSVRFPRITRHLAKTLSKLQPPTGPDWRKWLKNSERRDQLVSVASQVCQYINERSRRQKQLESNDRKSLDMLDKAYYKAVANGVPEDQALRNKLADEEALVSSRSEWSEITASWNKAISTWLSVCSHWNETLDDSLPVPIGEATAQNLATIDESIQKEVSKLSSVEAVQKAMAEATTHLQSCLLSSTASTKGKGAARNAKEVDRDVVKTWWHKSCLSDRLKALGSQATTTTDPPIAGSDAL